MVLVTLPDDVHSLLERIKTKKGFSNNAEAVAWIIEIVGKEEELINVN